jgi:proteasome lid subunit RPN8/RPN11
MPGLSNSELIRNQTYQSHPGSHLGPSHLSSALCGGGGVPVILASRSGDLHTYVVTYTQHTGLLGMPSSWRFAVVNVVDGTVTTWAR